MDELRIVLLGKQGAGKSSSGNTLLRKQSFQTAVSSKPETEACSMSMSTVDKQTIKVIDTPGWCDDSSLFETDVKQEIIKCINMSSPGPHVFLLVLPIGRFTKEEINTVMNILKEFGDEVTKYMIVLFTKGDDLKREPIEICLKEIHPELKKIIQLCGQRYHVFNNKDNKNDQVSSLLKKINEMVKRNEGKWYTTAMYQKGKNHDRGQQFKTEEDNSVQNKNINREHGRLKQFLISVGKMLELDKEMDTLFQERNELQRRLMEKEEVFKQKRNDLELQKHEVNQYEINELIQEVDKQYKDMESLKQDIEELKKQYGSPERCSDGKTF